MSIILCWTKDETDGVVEVATMTTARIVGQAVANALGVEVRALNDGGYGSTFKPEAVKRPAVDDNRPAAKNLVFRCPVGDDVITVVLNEALDRYDVSRNYHVLHAYAFGGKNTPRREDAKKRAINMAREIISRS